MNTIFGFTLLLVHSFYISDGQDIDGSQTGRNITAYWDAGDCGPDGNDHNWGWCNERTDYDQGRVFQGCREEVTTDECESGKAKLIQVYGNSTEELYERDGCQYWYYAEYECVAPEPEFGTLRWCAHLAAQLGEGFDVRRQSNGAPQGCVRYNNGGFVWVQTCENHPNCGTQNCNGCTVLSPIDCSGFSGDIVENCHGEIDSGFEMGGCAFHVHTDGDTCADWCREQNSTCINSRDGRDSTSCDIKDDDNEFCEETFDKQICVCAPKAPTKTPYPTLSPTNVTTTSSTPSPIDACVVEDNLKYDGNIWEIDPSDTWEECALRCGENQPHCKSWTFKKDSKLCNMKSEHPGNRVTSKQRISGTPCFDDQPWFSTETRPGAPVRQLGESCGSCFCLPDFWAGNCGEGLICDISMQRTYPDLPGTCVLAPSPTPTPTSMPTALPTPTPTADPTIPAPTSVCTQYGGILGGSSTEDVCCNAGCSQCGGEGCFRATIDGFRRDYETTTQNCCGNTIRNEQKYCEEDGDAPCVIRQTPTPTSMPTPELTAPTLSPTYPTGLEPRSHCLGYHKLRRKCKQDSACAWTSIPAHGTVGGVYNDSDKPGKFCVERDYHHCGLLSKRKACERDGNCRWRAGRKGREGGCLEKVDCETIEIRKLCKKSGCLWAKLGRPAKRAGVCYEDN